MLLYHLMADEGVLPNKVIPQVPQNLMQGEDQSIPRICVGQSLDDCLTGITVTGITIPFLLAEVKRAGAKQAWKKDFQFRLLSEPIVPSVTTRHFLMSGKFPIMSGTQRLLTSAG